MISFIIAGILVFIGGAFLRIYEKVIKPHIIEKHIKLSRTRKRIDFSVRIFSILIVIAGAYIGIKDTIDKYKQSKYAGLFVTPQEIFIPANASRNDPLIITNNADYPVFMIELEIQVIEGYLNVENNDLFLEPYKTEEENKSGTPFSYFALYGFKNATHTPFIIFVLPEIEARSSDKYRLKINGYKYIVPSKIKLSIISYTKEPSPNFSAPIKLDKNNKFTFPDTIHIPGLKMPKIYEK